MNKHLICMCRLSRRDYLNASHAFHYLPESAYRNSIVDTYTHDKTISAITVFESASHSALNSIPFV